jgi:cbb3-type cytochrome oxidase subunit 3
MHCTYGMFFLGLVIRCVVLSVFSQEERLENENENENVLVYNNG